MLNETIIWMKHKSNANSLIINGNWLVTELVNSIMTYHDENEGHHSDKFVAGAKLGNTNVSIGLFDFEFTGANRLAIVFFCFFFVKSGSGVATFPTSIVHICWTMEIRN